MFLAITDSKRENIFRGIQRLLAFALFHLNGLSQSVLISSKFLLAHQKKFQHTRGDKAAKALRK